MTIADKLAYLNTTKTQIKNAIIEKGGTITDTTTFREYATAIQNLNTSTSNEDLIGLLEGTITQFVIPDGTTKIVNGIYNGISVGAYKFNSLVIPSSVTQIGTNAFTNSDYLVSADLGNVQSIAYGAFLNCGLTNVKIPDTCTSIGSSAFSGNPLTKVWIPSTVQSVGTSAFISTASSFIVYTNASSLPSAWDGAFKNDNGSDATVIYNSTLEEYEAN